MKLANYEFILRNFVFFILGVIVFEQIIRRTIQRRILQFQLINLPTNMVDFDGSIVQSADSILYVYSITSLQSFNEVCEKYRLDYESKKPSLQ